MAIQAGKQAPAFTLVDADDKDADQPAQRLEAAQAEV
jgi:hypothetical protein